MEEDARRCARFDPLHVCVFALVQEEEEEEEEKESRFARLS